MTTTETTKSATEARREAAEARRAARDAAIATMPTANIATVVAEWRGLDSLSSVDFDEER